ncbi:peptidoglycan DD-metalloendopeptidase family protein [Bacillus sp. FSL W7-1360]
MKNRRMQLIFIGLISLFVVILFTCISHFFLQDDKQMPAPNPELEQAIVQSLIARTGGDKEKSAPILERKQIHLKRVTKDETWAFGAAVIEAPKVEHTFPEGWLFIARDTDEGWQVALEGDHTFSELTQKAPDEVISRDEKKVFSSNATTQSINTRTGLRLPYAVGQSWMMSGGPHGWSGYDRPYSSLDLHGGDQRVLAAREGYAYTMCNNNRGWIRIYHDNGYATDYYHLWNNIVPSGNFVSEGTFLGYTGTDVSCGGYASGRHVHFGILKDGNRAALQNKEIGGWIFFEGSAYGGYAMHGSAVRYRGHSLYNYGRLTTNQGIVDSYGWSSINLRSGPGSNYPIVGSRNDGAIISIDCTATGSSFTGRWGTTNIWNRLTNGQWISDAFVYTGVDGPAAPSCSASILSGE